MYVNDTAKMIQIWSNTNTQSANLLKNLLKKKWNPHLEISTMWKCILFLYSYTHAQQPILIYYKHGINHSKYLRVYNDLALSCFEVSESIKDRANNDWTTAL